MKINHRCRPAELESMPQFRYKGRTARGDLITGVLDADTADAVANQLFNTGITPIDIAPAPPEQDVMASLRRLTGGSRPGLDDLILFSRQMYSLTKAGVPLVRGLISLGESTRNEVLGAALRDVTETLESGRDLAGALSRHPEIFSPLYVNIIRVGENSGNLPDAFLRLYEYLSLEKDTRTRIKSAMRYPTFVVIAVAIAITIITIFVIPAFANVFRQFHAQLPLATRMILAVSNFAVHDWPIVLGMLAATTLAIRTYLRTEHGRYRWDRIKLRLPVIGPILVRASLARFARSFGMAYRSGVPLAQALSLVSRAVDNEYLGDRVIQMRNGVERGESISRTAAAAGVFTPLVIQMMTVGEETGGMEDMLEEIGDFYEREVDYDIKNLAQNIEPLLLLVVGGMVLILALGVFLPMWDLGRVVLGHGG